MYFKYFRILKGAIFFFLNDMSYNVFVLHVGNKPLLFIILYSKLN